MADISSYLSKACKPRIGFLSFAFVALIGLPVMVWGQPHISETSEQIKTYPFYDQNPVPIITKKPEIYPYSRFDGYSLNASLQKWKVITLQNDYIKLWVLPEVGGKIWGAIEKSTGNDFIYKNDVLKFRDVGLRGPWTSGGIEFNFGYFGHTPTTATSVNYVLKRNDDGSVSCWIGAIDLASRTRWRVEIRLPKDAADFQTRAFWYNGTSLNQSYYSWSNTAIHVGDSLQYYFPGNHYIGHRGDAHPWPIKDGRNLSLYGNNNFGGNKSYHVLGEYTNYYGAYQHNKHFGFGHWARFDELPGQKIWMWALSREGSIWEDLLTDDNGQYSEVQAGRLFNQAMLESGSLSPFNQYLFSPQAADQWKEAWFPVKDIDGIDDASRQASMNVIQGSASLKVEVNAITEIHDTLNVFASDKTLHKEAIDLKPMEVLKKTISVPAGQSDYTVTLGKNLSISTKPQQYKVQRPLSSPQKYDATTAEGLYETGEEHYAFRHYDKALQLFIKSLKKHNNNRKVLSRTAEIYTRKARYKQALQYAKRVLVNDTYDPEGNFIYGVINRRLGNLTEAKEAFGWAARSMKYRSAGWEQLAELNVLQHRWDNTLYYAQKALKFNAFNINAKKVLTIAYRKEHKMRQAHQLLTDMLKSDPLCHFAYFEKYLLNKTGQNKTLFTSLIRNELSHETYLELAMAYHNMGLDEEARQVLEMSPSNPIVNYWLAYLYKNDSAKSDAYLQKASTASPEFVFPFRHETIIALQWAINQDDDWKAKYYLGLILWSKGRNEDAMKLMRDCGNDPDFAAFYLSRSYLREDASPMLAQKDIERAMELDSKQWRAYRQMGNWYIYRNEYDEAAKILKVASSKFPTNYYIGSQYAQVLYKQGHYQTSLDVLNDLNMLPSEGAKHNHEIFEKDHLMLALQYIRSHNYDQAREHLRISRTWPEHLGIGKPFNPDERAQDFLEAYMYEAQHKSNLAASYYQKVIASSNEMLSQEDIQFDLGNLATILAYKRQGEQKKAEKLLSSLGDKLGSENPMFKWVEIKVSDKTNEQKNSVNNDSRIIPHWFSALMELKSL